MVSVRRHARDWIAYFARRGLIMGAVFSCSLRNIERKCNQNDPDNTGKKFSPGHCYKEYDHPTEEEHRTAEQFNWEREGLLSLIATVGVVGAAVFAFGAFHEARRQAVAAEGQLKEVAAQTDIARKSSRPYVLPVVVGDKVEFRPASGAPNNPTQIPASYSAQVQFTNFGVVPAVLSRTKVRISTAIKRDIPFEVDTFATSGVIQSGRSINHRPYTAFVLPEEFPRLFVGNVSLYIEIQVFYTDVTGNEFHTFFCFLQPTHHNDLRIGLQRVSDANCPNEIK